MKRSLVQLVVIAASAVTAGTVGAYGFENDPETCSPWACGENTPVLAGVPIGALHLGGAPSSTSQRLARALSKVNPDGSLRVTSCDLGAYNGTLIAQSSPRGACIENELVGSVFVIEVPNPQCPSCTPAKVKVKVDARGEVDTWVVKAIPDKVSTYRLSWYDLSDARRVFGEPQITAREGESICPMREAAWMEDWQSHREQQAGLVTPILDTDPWRAQTDRLLVLQGDTYLPDASIDTGKVGGDWINFACAGTALAKLRLLGYQPSWTGAPLVDPGAAERQATLKMITGHYRGATSYTRGGVPLLWRHRSGRLFAGIPDPATWSTGRWEARWGTAGALCVSHRRTWFALPPCTSPRFEDCLATLPSRVAAALRLAMPEEPSAAARMALAVIAGPGGALVYDYGGAEDRSLAALRAGSKLARCASAAFDASTYWVTHPTEHQQDVP